ncbi:hypothetical protein Tco_0928244, partial [Tanacetum coccineum]
STPPRPTTTTSSAPVHEQGPSSDPNIASSSRPHESAPDLFTSTNVEDETTGGSFHTSPPRSIQAPPAGTTSGGDEDLDKLTALSSLVSTLMQKVNTQESEFKAHKLLYKEVVGKLVKKVKLLEDKLKGRKRNFVMTDSDKEEDAEQDLIFLLVPLFLSDEFAGGSDVPVGATTGPSVDPSNKGKSPLLEEDPPVRERTFRQREEDMLGEEAARRIYKEEQDELEREREEMQRKRQQDVLNLAKYYTDSDWTDIIGQVHANQGLTADLLGPDVNEDNFAKRMVALIAKRRRDFAVQRFQDKRNKPMTYAQQKAYMRTFVKNQSSTIYITGWTMKHRSLKRPGADLEQASSKKSKPTEATKSDVPVDSPQPSAGVNVIYMNGQLLARAFSRLREILHLVTRTDLMIIYGRVMTFYQDKQATGVGLVLWGDLKVLIDSPEVNDEDPLFCHLERMLDHQLEICHDTVGNELTTAVQLIAFLKKQISDSRRPKVHDCPRLDVDCLVADSTHMKVALGVGFKMIVVPSFGIVTTSRYVVPTGRVKVPAGRYVVPTGKDNVIVPAGSTILVLVSILRKVKLGSLASEPTLHAEFIS